MSPDRPARSVSLSRTTSESSVELELDLDGTGESEISTGVRFYDHMLASLATHSLVDVTVKAKGDLQHHTVEDVAITLGKAISMALGDRVGILALRRPAWQRNRRRLEERGCRCRECRPHRCQREPRCRSIGWLAFPPLRFQPSRAKPMCSRLVG